MKQVILLFARLADASNSARDQDRHGKGNKSCGQIAGEPRKVEQELVQVHGPHNDSTLFKKGQLGGGFSSRAANPAWKAVCHYPDLT